MEMDWTPEAVKRMAVRMGLSVKDFSPPIARRVQGPAGPLNVFDWGGAGEPLLALHGGALTGRTWDFVALQLRHAFRVIAPDLRGHGDSHWADGYCLNDHVEDVLAILTALSPRSSHFVGMSLGGVVAAMIASAAPSRCRSLTLVDVAPGVDFESTSVMRAFLAGIADAPALESVVDAAMRVSPRSDRECVEYRFRTLLRADGNGRWRLKFDRRKPPDYPSILDMVGRLDLLAAAANVPVMLVRGADSRVLSDLAARRFVRSVPGARLTTVPNAGHNVQEDNPRDLARSIEFLLQP
jgi:pimeloyl-ACP methyl ester carboxylesterase